MRIIGIAIVSANGVLGDGEDQPFKFDEDWARYREVTMGHPMIMGRKTHEAIGRFLPGRTTIILTSQPDQVPIPEGADGVAVGSFEEALAEAERRSDTVFIAGGGSVYDQAWPVLTDLDLTEVHADAEGSVVLPPVDPDEWREVRREVGDQFDFVGYERVATTEPRRS